MILAKPLEHRVGQYEGTHLRQYDDENPRRVERDWGSPAWRQEADEPAQRRTDDPVDPAQAIDIRH